VGLSVDVQSATEGAVLADIRMHKYSPNPEVLRKTLEVDSDVVLFPPPPGTIATWPLVAVYVDAIRSVLFAHFFWRFLCL
jgi:hypothetical protein